jgi:pyruvate/2-oxoglutarate dehydrogenase complex dihydrolipoamide acyltransferase (E2) component
MFELKVPPITETITEVTVGEWLKTHGQFVKIDEAICEIETAVAVIELWAEKEGYLEIMTPKGNILPVGATLAKIHAQPLDILQDQDFHCEQCKDGLLTQLKIAQNAIKMGFSNETIASLTGLPPYLIEQTRQNG